jgi:hypothetical protein
LGSCYRKCALRFFDSNLFFYFVHRPLLCDARSCVFTSVRFFFYFFIFNYLPHSENHPAASNQMTSINDALVRATKKSKAAGSYHCPIICQYMENVTMTHRNLTVPDCSSSLNPTEAPHRSLHPKHISVMGGRTTVSPANGTFTERCSHLEYRLNHSTQRGQGD